MRLFANDPFYETYVLVEKAKKSESFCTVANKNKLIFSKIGACHMFPTNDVLVFIRENDSELRRMVTHLCENLNYPGSPEDIVQDMYLKFLTSEIIQMYNPFCNGVHSAKMSTYIFPIIRNFIISKLKSHEYRLVKYKLPDYDTATEDIDDIDLIIRHNPIALEFRNRLLNNDSTDNVEGLGADMRDFERSFNHSSGNKRYSLSKRKFQHVKTSGCSLSDIFQYLYKGYSSKEIAEIYGVTNMSITNMKYKLAQAMMKYGFMTQTRTNTDDPVKMPEMSE